MATKRSIAILSKITDGPYSHDYWPLKNPDAFHSGLEWGFDTADVIDRTDDFIEAMRTAEHAGMTGVDSDGKIDVDFLFGAMGGALARIKAGSPYEGAPS